MSLWEYHFYNCFHNFLLVNCLAIYSSHSLWIIYPVIVLLQCHLCSYLFNRRKTFCSFSACKITEPLLYETSIGVPPGKVAVMQICCDTVQCLVLHLIHSGIPRNLQLLLEDSTVLKVLFIINCFFLLVFSLSICRN